jgi:hypothetical protein
MLLMVPKLLWWPQLVGVHQRLLRPLLLVLALVPQTLAE